MTICQETTQLPKMKVLLKVHDITKLPSSAIGDIVSKHRAQSAIGHVVRDYLPVNLKHATRIATLRTSHITLHSMLCYIMSDITAMLYIHNYIELGDIKIIMTI